MRTLKIALSICAMIIALLLVLPFALGFLIEAKYKGLVASTDSSNDIRIEVKSFRRGWFTSDAELQFKIISPYLKSLQFFNVTPDSPEVLTFNLTQHLVHGPVFYHHIQFFPYFFGLASIHTITQLPKDAAEYIHFMDDHGGIYTHDDFVTLTGKYVDTIDVPPIELAFPKSNLHLQINGLKGKLIISPSLNRLKGQISVSDVVFFFENNKISMPSMQWNFNYKTAAYGVWIGKTTIAIPALDYRDQDNYTVQLLGTKIRGVTEEVAGFLRDAHDLQIEKMQFDNDFFGPLYVGFTISNISTKSIADFIETYKKILREGEVYQSQLKQKVLFFLPKIITPETALSLNTFSLSTPKGKIFLQGEVTWPDSTETVESVAEFIKGADFKTNMRITKSLLNDLIRDAAQFPLFYKVSLEEQKHLQDLENDMNDQARQNAMSVISLAQEQKISENAAMELLEIQKSDENVPQYRHYVKDLYLKHLISREISYYLNWRFNQVANAITTLDQAVTSVYANSENDLRSNFKKLMDGGFVQQDAQDYYISFRRDNGEYKSNR